MSYTLTQKILMRNTGLDSVKVGDIVMVKPARVMLHEAYTEQAEQFYQQSGFTRIKEPEKVVLFLDHTIPICRPGRSTLYNAVFRFARKYGVTHVHVGEGMMHTLFHELQYIKPGEVMLGCDSHSGTCGAGACAAFPIGHADMCAYFGTGELWIRVPSAIKVVIDGELPEGVYSKDIALKLLGDIKAAGAQYKSLEFCGSTIRSLSMDARYSLNNMAIECGAKNGVMEADEKTAAYFGMDLKELEWLKCGPDEAYERVIRYRAEDLTPMAACPPTVDNVKSVKEVEGTPLTQVYFGSCTNSSLEDMKAFAEMVRGCKVDKYFKLLVSIGSVDAFKQATALGYIQEIVRAGGMVLHPSCCLCCGTSFGIMDEHGVMAATNNRNFKGRQGHKDAQCYLVSPATAGISAVMGKMTDPTPYMDRISRD